MSICVVVGLGSVCTLAALSGDLQSYLQFFSGPQATIQDVARALGVEALERTALALAVLVGGWYLVRFLVGAARRAELHDHVRPHLRSVVVGVVVVALVGTVLTSSLGRRDRPSVSQRASAVFDGTPLEGARVTGRLGGVIDTYGGQVVAELRKNEKFYAEANASLQAAWDERQELLDARSRPRPAAQRRARPDPTRTRTCVTVVVVSDLHCNVGMAPLIRTVVERSGADLVLDAGDTTINGTSVEQYCVTTFARAVPGRRGAGDVARQPRLRGDVEELRARRRDGAGRLGGRGGRPAHPGRQRPERDARRGRRHRAGGQGVRRPTRPTGSRTSRATTPTASTCCSSTRPPWARRPWRTAASPRRSRATCTGGTGRSGWAAGSGTSARARPARRSGQATVGPLHGVAEMTVLRWDPDTRRFVDYQLVQVRPDTTATVSPRLRWPRPPRCHRAGQPRDAFTRVICVTLT